MRARARGLFGDARSRRWDAAVGVGVRPFSVSQVDSEKKITKKECFVCFSVKNVDLIRVKNGSAEFWLTLCRENNELASFTMAALDESEVDANVVG